jgi:glycosyltransferase involved in cell wall biosynthesis
MVSLLVTTYNRPNYLHQCLDSVKKADLSQLDTVMVIDDCSTDKETIRLINEFELEGVHLIKAFSKENRSIKGSLLFGCDLLFNSCDIVINLDGDAIVATQFVNVLMKLKERFQENIITGFCCFTKNIDGSERHAVLKMADDYTERKSVGGINMLFDVRQYNNWIRPTLLKCIEQGGNWDDHTCRASIASGHRIITSRPSVVQHIGTEFSSMGHSVGGEPPDEASDFVYDEPKDYGTRLIVRTGNYGETTHAKLDLPAVTLIAVDDNVEGIIKAADISCQFIRFASVKLLSSMPSKDKRVIPIRHLGSKRSYSEFMMKEVVDYIETPFFATIQADGYILRYESWDDNWFNFDYIGSPWEWYTDGYNTGNGAASFRSRRLHQILKDDSGIVPTNDHLIRECQEDHNIARIYRKYLEDRYGIKFAPIEVSRRFGIEAWNVKPPGNKYNNQFCFHGRHVDFSDANIWHIPY